MQHVDLSNLKNQFSPPAQTNLYALGGGQFGAFCFHVIATIDCNDQSDRSIDLLHQTNIFNQIDFSFWPNPADTFVRESGSAIPMLTFNALKN